MKNGKSGLSRVTEDGRGRIRLQKAMAKKERQKERRKVREKMGDGAPPLEQPRTIENTREFDLTMVDADDAEILHEEANDEMSSYFNRVTKPKVLITTSSFAKVVSLLLGTIDMFEVKTFRFCYELEKCIPDAKVLPRKGIPLKKVIKQAVDKSYTDVIVVNENRKMPSHMIISHLPDGPTASFKINNLCFSKNIPKVGESTEHFPEIILNNFNTRLGRKVARMFACLFPHDPMFRGRRVVTFHNQRDYIFFRHHRYEFKSLKKVAHQELGPRFTLRLKWLQNGTFDTQNGEYEWILKMIVLPFLHEFLDGLIKPSLFADAVDQLNCYYSALILGLATLTLSCKQYFGAPIRCFVPMEFAGGWEQYAEDYCFIQGSYYLPFNHMLDDREGATEIVYYKWVPVLLSLQSLMFFLPNFFLRRYKKKIVKCIEKVDTEAKHYEFAQQNKTTKLENSAYAILSTLSHPLNKTDRTNRNTTLAYLFTKFVNIISIFAQLFYLNHIFGGKYISWGYKTMIALGTENKVVDESMFPKRILCDFEVRRMGNFPGHTVECLLILNLIYEKLYFLIWLGLFSLGAVTVINFVHSILQMFVANMKVNMVFNSVQRQISETTFISSGLEVKDMHLNFLQPDLALVLNFIKQRVTPTFFDDLLSNLVTQYCGRDNSTKSSPLYVHVSSTDGAESSREEMISSKSSSDSKKTSNDSGSTRSVHP